MQVERQQQGQPVGGEWRTGEEYMGICLVVGDNVGKLTLIPHTTDGESGDRKASRDWMSRCRIS